MMAAKPQANGANGVPSGLTSTQRRMLRMLRDGEYHRYLDLAECLDEFQEMDIDFEKLFEDEAVRARVKQAVKVNMVDLRRALEPGEVIICETIGYSRGYRLAWHRSYKIIQPPST